MIVDDGVILINPVDDEEGVGEETIAGEEGRPHTVT